MVILSGKDGKILTTLPLAGGSNAVAFNLGKMEAFSSHGHGTMTILKESSPASFAVEQSLQTMVGAKTLTFEKKSKHIFTMTAEYGPVVAPTTPPVEGGAPQGRGNGGPMLAGSFSILVIGR